MSQPGVGIPASTSPRVVMYKRPAQRKQNRGSRGQALVEFSLVLLLFMTIFMGVIEFGSAFAVKIQISFASRDAATVAAESGGSPATADGAILNQIDRDVQAPAARANIDHVDIYWSKADGTVNSGAIERYTPGGLLFPGWGGWTNAMDAYPGSSRCAFIGGTTYGCLTGHTGPDTIGVSIVYRYSWVTPLPNLVSLAGTGMTFTQTNLSTMEPIPAI